MSRPISRWLMIDFLSLCRTSIGSSMVTMWRRIVRLMWSIIAASVVVLPEPVVPVTSTRPRGSSGEPLDDLGQMQLLERRDLGRHLAHGDADAAALAEDVDAEAPEVRQRVGEVDLVVLAEPADLLVRHDRGRDVLGVFGRERRLVQEDELAVDADDRRAPRLDVEVGRVARHHVAEQFVDRFHVAAPVVVCRLVSLVRHPGGQKLTPALPIAHVLCAEWARCGAGPEARAGRRSRRRGRRRSRSRRRRRCAAPR